MNLYLSKTHSDEEGPNPNEGKLGIIYSSKENVKRLAKFLNEVAEYLNENEYCHMHFRDSFDDWSKTEHIDLEINVDERINEK